MKKTTLLVFLLCCLPILFGGCGWEKPLKVGVTAGPHTEIMWVVKGVAEKNGLNIEIVEYPDYVQPNVALTQGSIDANSLNRMDYYIGKGNTIPTTLLTPTDGVGDAFIAAPDNSQVAFDVFRRADHRCYLALRLKTHTASREALASNA